MAAFAVAADTTNVEEDHIRKAARSQYNGRSLPRTETPLRFSGTARTPTLSVAALSRCQGSVGELCHQQQLVVAQYTFSVQERADSIVIFCGWPLDGIDIGLQRHLTTARGSRNSSTRAKVVDEAKKGRHIIYSLYKTTYAAMYSNL